MHIWLLLLSTAGILGLFVLGFLFSRTPKNPQVWEKLDETKIKSSGSEQGNNGAKTENASAVIPAAPIALQNKPSPADSLEALPQGTWEDSEYCWVVVCKNKKFHRTEDPLHGHRIPLAWTDPFTLRPAIATRFAVRCDDCRGEYSYEPSEVLKFEQSLPESFTPHPLFREEA
jgi:hypothetical protein